MSLDVSRTYFTRVSRDYDRYSSWTANQSLIDAELALLSEYGGSALVTVDVGAGTCAWLDWVARSGIYGDETAYVAIDSSNEMLRMRPRLSQLRVLRADAHRLPIASARADRIFGRQILHYVDVHAVLEEFRRVSAPGAIFHSTQQVDYDELPSAWYDNWSALRNAPTRRRLSDADLSSAARAQDFIELDRRDVILPLRYRLSDLCQKYGPRHSKAQIRAFFESWDATARTLFSLEITDEVVEYSSRFRVSAFRVKSRTAD